MSPRRHSRWPASGGREDGFALIAVLAVIAFTGITIAALLTMMTTTMRVTASQERAAAERRAADGAIENSIEMLRNSADRDTLCSPASPLVLESQTIGGVEVDVECSPATGLGGGTDQVRLVGTQGYQGTFRGWNADCPTNPDACLPWSDAGVDPSGTVPSDVLLVHSGAEPLEFASGVTVRTGAAVMRNPVGEAPAVNVGGDYNQGAAGIGGSGGTDCGMLAGAPGAGAGRILDLSGDPSCGVTEAAEIAVNPSGAAAGLVVDPNLPAPNVPSNCPSSAVVTFQPGEYNAAATRAVDRLVSGTGSRCNDSKTFHFLPGVYSFRGGELRFNAADSAYVFGEPLGWTPTGGVTAAPAVSNDPDAALCDTTRSGASLILAGWTRLTHERGRLAICPKFSDSGADADDESDAHPAIYQQLTVPTEVHATIDTNTSPSRTRITQPFRCRARLFAEYPDEIDFDGYGRCRPQRKYVLHLSTDGGGPVRSLRVMLTGNEPDTPNNLVSNRVSRFELRSASNARLCHTDWVPGVPNGGFTSSFDLMEVSGDCSTATLDQSQLDGARILVDHRMDLAFNPLLPEPRQTLTITGAEIEVNSSSGTPTTATAAGWHSPQNATTAGSESSPPVMPCTEMLCPVADPGGTRRPADLFEHELTVSNFGFPDLVISADEEEAEVIGLRAVVKVKPSAASLPDGLEWFDPENFLIPAEFQIELRSPSGARCIAQAGGMNSDQEITFDLVGADNHVAPSPDCNSFNFDLVEDLQDLTLTVKVRTECARDWLRNQPWLCFRLFSDDVFQIRPPDIEQVRLTALTNTYTSVTTSRATLDATADAGSSTVAVHGRTWMPLTDLDLYWNGPASSAPLFANDLVLNGLGSRVADGAATGVVCCAPPSTDTVELTAYIGGIERFVTRVWFDDSSVHHAGGPTANVLRWHDCRGACASVLGTTETNPDINPGDGPEDNEATGPPEGGPGP